ncbi:putative non-ribosomal peptide synthetase [Xylaria sp. CBS 124048]|nr:putative non-ribosomal peptide synthetase [Xylaria sp. CBS 124048]
MSLGSSDPPPPDGLSILNANPLRIAGPVFLHDLVAQASNDGLSAAVDFRLENGHHTILSYPELHAASLTLANEITGIIRSGVCASAAAETDDPLIIPILSPQSPQLYTAILAILKAGCCFCPLNVDAPPDRVRFILEDVKAKVVLVTRNLASRLPVDDKKYEIIFIDDVLSELETHHDDFIDHHRPELKPEDLAYVMYTSGSTGTPKGVAISHLAATQSILAHERHVPRFSRFLQFAAPTFDVSIFEIFFPLFRGATLVGCNRTEMLTDLAGVLRRMEIDACELTPSVAGSMLRQRSRAPGLRLLLTIGEMLTDPVIREFGGDGNKGSMLWGMYGPTEASIHCTVQAAFSTGSQRSTIGTPLDTVSVFVIRISTDPSTTSHFEVLPTGEVGELALGGLQLATYYLNRPDQTANSFVNTPWGRVYRTGDKAKIRPDGTIECLGRIDDSQIKLNGQRLELGEIEQVLLQVPGCHSAFVTVISNILVAFTAIAQITSDSNTQLLDRCRSWLPTFMVPADIVVMEQLPQLPSGKIDRKQLVNDYVARTSICPDNEKPIDELEALLCEVLSTLLDERASPLTEFSMARLDSLSAIEYASLLGDRGVFATPIDVLSAKTPRELRRSLDNRRTLASGLNTKHRPTSDQPLPSLSDIRKLKPELGHRLHDIVRIERSTPLQQSMIAETLKGTDLYINKVEFELTAPATIDILKSSLGTLAKRNEILRTGFAFLNSQLFQVIWNGLDNAQIYDNTDGQNPAGEVEDVETFLLRPLTMEIQRPTSTANPLRLVMTLHHAIYDGWTVDLMIEDLSLLLSGLLPTERPQFSHIVSHVHDSPEVESIDSMEFWTEHLHGLGAISPSDLRTVAVSESRWTINVTKIPLQPGVLRDFMGRALVGPQVLFQACAVWLWAAVQGNEDIAIGCVSSGRTLPIAGIERIMGPCMTTLPLRINISRYKTILELVQGIHSINRETLRHGSIPLSKIHKAADLPANAKLFDVIFSYQESLASRRRKANVVRESWHRDATEAKLVIEIQPCEDHFLCQMTFKTDALPAPLVSAFTNHLICLVDYACNNFEMPIETIPQCFPLDSLSHFNDNPGSRDVYSSLSQMVEASASRFPSAAALRFAVPTVAADVNLLSLSYYELNSKANQIAQHLKEYAPITNGIIAVIMEKSPLLYCSILGILKTGCAYLPILPTTPFERVRAILGQAEPCLCIVDTISSSLIGGEVLNIINVETVDLTLYPTANLSIPGRPSDLAYVIYTSGTTGTPKGVAVTNKNILSNISVLSDIYPHDPSSRMLQACSQAFDVSVFEIFFAWANGMCLCAATNETLFDDFEEIIRSFEITHLSLTVSVASLLSPESVPSVQFLVTSGEPMTDEVFQKWSQHLYQGYGPSETTNICTVRKVFKDDSPHFLGWSFENTSTFVVYPDSTQLVPVGCVGELCFGGDQVAFGYLKLPEMTAAKFIDHPDYGRIYRSGDLGRMLPDGSVIIQGRIDTQIKLRGLRIELDEIQATALRTGLTRTCKTVLVTSEIAKHKQLAFFYVPFEYEATKFHLLPLTSESEKQIRTLRHAFQTYLPEYMVPTFILPMSVLPLTSSGKVDEGTLRSSVEKLSVSVLSAYSSAEDQGDEISNWSETEILISNVITDLSKQDGKKIGRWTTFAALGLDSLSAMPVARRLQLLLRKRVPLSLVLQNRSISRLASAIDQEQGPDKLTYADGSLLPVAVEENIRGRFTTNGRSVAKILPCTPLQQAMVMSSINSSPTTTLDRVNYYNQMLFHLRVPYEAMMSLWSEVVRRHEILRACFIISDDIRYPAIQVILDDYTPKWQVLEVEAASLQKRASQHFASVTASTDRYEPPIALAIFRTKESGDYLSFVCHHAMYDGISMQIILSEIEALYQCRTLSAPPSLEPFLREIQLSSPGRDDFWRQLFHGFHPTILRCERITDDSMPGTLSVKATTMAVELIEFRLRSLGVSMLALVHTSWAITLSILSQRSDVSFGNVVNGRSVPLDMADKLVAPCFNTLPMRMDLSLSTFLIDVMKEFQNLNARMVMHQFTSLQSIQKLIETQTRLFDSLVILQPPAAPLDETLWSLVHEDGLMDIPIVCEVIPAGRQEPLMIQLHRDKLKVSYQDSLLISKILGHVISTCLQYPSSHVPTCKTLPGDLRKDVRQLFADPECSPSSESPSQLTSDTERRWSSSELMVRRTLATLVGIPEDHIERLTPIYHYGLDSITAIQLATLLRQQDIFISVTEVIQHPTCAGIASAINSFMEDSFESYDFESFQRQIEGSVLESGIDLEILEAVLPCTSTQQGLLSQFMDSNGQYYFNYTSHELDEATNLDAVVHAWSQLVHHHQILRTGFIPINHPESSFAMLVYHKNHVDVPISIHPSGEFDDEPWFSESISDALHTLARPPWRIALETTGVADKRASMKIHLAIHHALYDAFTLRNLLQDLSDIIFHASKPNVASLEVAISHHIGLVQSSQSAGETFWKKKADDFVFHAFPVMTVLRVDTLNTLTASHTCSFSSSCLRQAASNAGVTVRAALQAAWARLLSAYTGESRVTFGVVLDGRATSLAQETTLPMIITVPVIAENITSNLEMVQQMMQYNSDLQRCQFMPITHIKRFLGITTPMFDTILLYQAANKATKPPPFHVVKELASVEYPVSLEVEELPTDTIQLNLSFKASILPKEQAALLLTQFEAILADLLFSDETTATPLAISRPDLFSILPATCESLPTDKYLLHELVEASSQLIPSALALEYTDEINSSNNPRIWTYQELDALGNQIAHFIISCGIEVGGIIAICFDKCPMAYFTILGILKAGCAFLCLDPSAPASRQTFILDDSNAAMLLLGESFDWAREPSLPVHIIDENTLASLPNSRPLLQRQLSPSDLCYCLYTSGTTGTPKGCLMTHENTVQAMAAFKHLFAGRWNSESKWLQFAALHFDVSVLEQYWSWYVGITVVAAPKDVILSDLAMTITKLGITHIDLTPSLARLISPEECPSLCEGVFITGGEKLRSDILETWGAKRVIYNAYGPTETTIGVTMYRGVPENGRPSNIGSLFANVGGYVFERNSETPVLRGGVGELCVSGKLVGKGYLNREELTRERFPVLQASGERIYRTGDLVRVLHDDSIDFLGRADDQVKLRGQRLEIGEINHTIRESLDDKTGDVTTVVTRRKAQENDLLVSFVSLSSDSTTSGDVKVSYNAEHLEFARRAREACRSRLATYMVPTFILCISRIPLTTNNKVDANKLKKLFSELSNEQVQILAVLSVEDHRPLNRLEKEVLEAIYQVVPVRVDDISPTTTVYQLGIDSITATRVAKRLRTIGFESATASLILQHPEINQLTRALDRLKSIDRAGDSLHVNQVVKALRHRYLRTVHEVLEVNATEVEYIAPCTPLQQGIIARSMSRDARIAYFNQFRLRLDSDVSIDRLKAALSRVINSYSILRTAFVDTPDGYLQVAIKDRPLRWFEVEADAESFERIISDRQNIWIEENRRVLRWPVEADHVKENDKQYLLLRLFHGVYDAHSLGLILKSVKAEYDALRCVSGPSFISVLLGGSLLGHRKSHGFWRTLLKHHHFQPMPSLIDTPTTTSNVVSRSVSFDGLEDRRKTLQVTHQTLLQAAWLRTLRQYFVDPPTIGVILSGRSLAVDDIDLVVGPLFNTLPLRVDFNNETSWASLARRIQEVNNGLLAFVHTPLRDIQKLCADGRPLFDTLFTFDRDYGDKTKNDQALWSIEESPPQPDYPLAIDIMMTEDDTLHVTLVAQEGIANEQALESLLDQFTESLNSAISHPGDAIAQAFRAGVHTSASVPATQSTINHTTTPAVAFEWNDEVYDVRRKIADLAKVDEKDISEATNLFALGLDSIDMIKLAGALTRLGHLVSVSTLMKQQTFGSVITCLQKVLPSMTSPTSTAELDRVVSALQEYHNRNNFESLDVEAILPPTPLQDSMVAEMVRSEFHAYFNHDILEIPPDIDISRLKLALLRVYADSPILRTVFFEIDDPRIRSAYYQVIRKHELEFSPILKISSMDEISTFTDMLRLRALENHGTSNLFQVHFMELGTKTLLVLSIAHALYDGWSLHMLHRDIQAAYEGDYMPRQSYTPYLSRMLSPLDTSSQQFWAGLLYEAHPTLLPERRREPQDDAILRFEKDSKRNVTDIRALCKSLHVTPQVLGQACWAIVFASLVESLDVVFGVVLSGRDTEVAQGLMFPTMNTVPLRLALHGTVAEFMEHCQHIMSSLIEFQHTPLREIQKLAQCHGAGLFNTLFLLQNVGDNELNGGFLNSLHSVSTIDYPLCAELEFTGTNAIWRIACDNKYLSQRDIEKLGSSLESVLDFFAADASAQILKFESSDANTISICGLEPTTFNVEVQNYENFEVKNEPITKQIRSPPEGYEALLDVLSDLSQVSRDEIDLDLSIFHLGLDSISAIKASSMLRRRGFMVSPRDLTTMPSIHAIIEDFKSQTHEKPEHHEENSLRPDSFIDGKEIGKLTPGTEFDASSIGTILTCLPMQTNMLSVWQSSGGAVFFPQFTFKVSGSVDLVNISRAWTALVDEVAMLRTRFISTTSSSIPFLQVILKPKFAREQATHIVKESDGRWQFVYSVTPFALAHFSGERPGEVILNLHLHHALYDGVSLPIILDRFTELCSSVPPVAVPDHRSSWFEFTAKHLSTLIQTQRKSFWISYLSGDVCSRLSGLCEHTTASSSQRVSEFRSISISNVAAIKSSSSAHGISTQSLLFAAYSKVFAKLLCREGNLDDKIDCVFGIYLANRSAYRDIESVPFPTLNILPLRVRDPLRQSITAVASCIHRDIAEISSFENSTASLWEIQEWTDVRVDTTVNILARLDISPASDSTPVALEKVSNIDSPSEETLDVSQYFITPDSESLSQNLVAHFYTEGVDIEMALHGNVLELGVFGPSSLMSATQAGEIIASISAEIEAL